MCETLTCAQAAWRRFQQAAAGRPSRGLARAPHAWETAISWDRETEIWSPLSVFETQCQVNKKQECQPKKFFTNQPKTTCIYLGKPQKNRSFFSGLATKRGGGKGLAGPLKKRTLFFAASLSKVLIPDIQSDIEESMPKSCQNFSQSKCFFLQNQTDRIFFSFFFSSEMVTFPVYTISSHIKLYIHAIKIPYANVQCQGSIAFCSSISGQLSGQLG